MNKLKLFAIILFISGFSARIFGQEKPLEYNPNSVYPVHEEHKLYKMTVWRRMDLREKQNIPFFSVNNEITRIIMDAVNDGRLIPYVNDSLTRRMTKEDFLENLKIESGEDEQGWGSGTEGAADAWGTGGAGGTADAWGSGTTGGADAGFGTAGPKTQYLYPTDLKLLEIKEEVFFDKVRSRLYYDIQSITVVKTEAATGLERPVGTFRFKDLEELFRSMPNEAIWYNMLNTAQHRNMADAFVLRLFSARVIKISNPENLYITDIYLDDQLSLYMSQYLEHKMMEYEHDLWEY